MLFWTGGPVEWWAGGRCSGARGSSQPCLLGASPGSATHACLSPTPRWQAHVKWDTRSAAQHSAAYLVHRPHGVLAVPLVAAEARGGCPAAAAAAAAAAAGRPLPAHCCRAILIERLLLQANLWGSRGTRQGTARGEAPQAAREKRCAGTCGTSAHRSKPAHRQPLAVPPRIHPLLSGPPTLGSVFMG